MRIEKSTSAISTAEELSKAWEFVNNEAELADSMAGSFAFRENMRALSERPYGTRAGVGD